MIHANIRAESHEGRVVREVGRKGERVEVSVADEEGRQVEVILNAKGQLRIIVTHPEQREPAMWMFTPEGFYDMGSHHDNQRPRATARPAAEPSPRTGEQDAQTAPSSAHGPRQEG